jgi:hypothetical protein
MDDAVNAHAARSRSAPTAMRSASSASALSGGLRACFKSPPALVPRRAPKGPRRTIQLARAASQTPSGASFEDLCFRKGRLRRRAMTFETDSKGSGGRTSVAAASASGGYPFGLWADAGSGSMPKSIAEHWTILPLSSTTHENRQCSEKNDNRKRPLSWSTPFSHRLVIRPSRMCSSRSSGVIDSPSATIAASTCMPPSSNFTGVATVMTTGPATDFSAPPGSAIAGYVPG